ncbi:microfibril-associated glycoprotein 4-like [Oculina patagonica]
MAGRILKGILFLLFFQFMCESLVCGAGLSQRTTGNGCPICKLLKTLVNKQKDLEKKIDLLLGAKANCSSVNQKDCADVYSCGQTVSGVYTINPDGQQPFDVYCDQTTAGGGWTVFQKRLDGSVDFYRGWNDYKTGFGHLNGEYWLGLDKLHGLTTNNNKRYKLRVDLEDTTGNTAYAEYGYFAVSSEQSKYQMSLGTYYGTAGDSLSRHKSRPFSTKDRDNDSWGDHCAVKFHGAWWYGACHSSNLNGRYLLGAHSSYADGVNWHAWKGYHYSAKRAEMKIRPDDWIPS